MHQFLYGHGQAETVRKIAVVSVYPANALSSALSKLAKVELSYRDVEDMLAERGIDVSYETVRRWALKFGTIIARKLRRGRPRPDGRSSSTSFANGSISVRSSQRSCPCATNITR